MSRLWHKLRDLTGWIFPRVCPACEGGSGFVRDPSTGDIRVCPVCQGSGRPSKQDGNHSR